MIHLHVLLVDDDADTRRTVKAALGLDPFFTVRDCASGAQAPTAAVAWRPDLILLDVSMPDRGGPALVRRLRGDKRTAPIPVVFLTALAKLAERRRFTALGAAGVITQPFDPLTSAAEVRRFVAVEGILSPVREGFMQRLRADADALAAWRAQLTRTPTQAAVTRIGEIAHSLAGAGGVYGFAGITCASAALSAAVERHLAGRAKPVDVERALNRLLERISA
ncbi:MAG: response regulator [Xanthobacteraceae bacterium]|nr:response regulator [Xanthobacteraceae bacterium]